MLSKEIAYNRWPLLKIVPVASSLAYWPTPHRFPMSTDSTPGFADLGLADSVLAAIKDLGYETPSPIQLGAIPPLLEGRDLIGQAQTGTGKTAAFALPLLSRIDISVAQPQMLVLAPTRELALQVAEAMQSYARHLKGFHVLPVYGGQGMDHQLRQLRRGVHAIVGTPGRIKDHLKRGTLVHGSRINRSGETTRIHHFGFNAGCSDRLGQLGLCIQRHDQSQLCPGRI